MAKGDKLRKQIWQKRNSKSFKREIGTRGKPYQRILIVCEGEKTEPNYFRQFRVTSADIEVVGKGYNTLSLVQEAIRLKRKARRDDEPFDQVWCVFDVDSFPPENVNGAWQMAKKNSVRTALSNEAFELWFLLHFDYITAAHSRDLYQEMLSQRLGKKYKKNSTQTYRDLYPMQARAIENAEKLIAQYHPRRPFHDKPCTEVHQLVMELNRQK